MKVNNELDPQLVKKLARLRPVPERDPHAAARGRARYLTEAVALQPKPAGIGRPVTSRRMAWKFVMAALAAFVLFFGGSVGAAFAAQDALPGETLYPVKLMSEDVRLNLTPDPQAGIDLLMQFVAVRISEMTRLTDQGNTIPAETIERLENQIQQALQLAAGLGDEEMQTGLTHIRTQLEEQVQNVSQGSGEAGDSMVQARLMLLARIRFVDEGLIDPEAFRNQVRNGQGDTGQPPTPITTPIPTGGQGGNSTPGGPDQTPGPQQSPEKTPGPTNGSGHPATPGGSGPGGKQP